MALRTDKYYDKRDCEIKPAIAIAKIINTSNNCAIFYIGKNRELIEQDIYYDSIIIENIQFDRNDNLFEQAYSAAKGYTTTEYEDEEIKTVYVPNYFHDWEDMIPEV